LSLPSPAKVFESVRVHRRPQAIFQRNRFTYCSSQAATHSDAGRAAQRFMAVAAVASAAAVDPGRGPDRFGMLAIGAFRG
jgi:hypothetical protein